MLLLLLLLGVAAAATVEVDPETRVCGVLEEEREKKGVLDTMLEDREGGCNALAVLRKGCNCWEVIGREEEVDTGTERGVELRPCFFLAFSSRIALMLGTSLFGGGLFCWNCC